MRSTMTSKTVTTDHVQPTIHYQSNAKIPLWRPLLNLWREHRGLIRSMIQRELSSRYKGSLMGLGWAIISPAVMIVIFTIIFSGIFSARFGNTSGHLSFAVYLFCGLLPWMAFSDSVLRATNALLENINLVKRVVFPIEALPVNLALAGVVTQLLGTVVLLIAHLILAQQLHVTVLWLPVLLIPQLLMTLGLGWLMASLGVFLRDMPQINQLVLMAWMYLTPIFFPENLVPPQFQWLIRYNPMAPLIRSYRRALLEGQSPDWRGLSFTLAFAVLCFVVGYWWFQRTKKAFADLL
ncbi:MAG TPA: ABC transporter permease [Blastocatellia bacterium]|nr:ABC transporter permease [Blastocatellia bacterium]